MSKKGLPFDIKMRHDSHYVDELARSNRSVGRKIKIELLAPNPNQPRTEIGDLTELAGSIQSKGILEPILVKPDPQSGTWMIIAGERRWRAANIAGLTEVPCIELDIDEKDIAEIALIENLQRKDLTIWEEADGFAYLIQRFEYTHEEIAKKIGKSRSTITESLAIAGLPADIRAKCLKANINTKSALLEIARQFDERAMHEFLDKPSQPRAFSRTASPNQKTSKITVKKPRAPGEFSGSNENSANDFNFHSTTGKFTLRLTFNNGREFNSSEVLAALKEVFNAVKAEAQNANQQ